KCVSFPFAPTAKRFSSKGIISPSLADPPETRLLLPRQCCNIEFDALSMRLDKGKRVMDLSRDIHPLTDFKRNTSEYLTQLKQTGEPLVLTINGKAELVVQDAKSYQRLLDIAERLETIQAVKEGLASIENGEGRSLDGVFDEIEKGIRKKVRP